MGVHLPVYLDNHSTTRVDPRVVEAMLPYFSEHYGNAASTQHQFGWTAEAAVETARSRIAELVGADAPQIIFTSGATESVNLALKGIAEGYASHGNHIITAAAEHRAVLDTCARLEKAGYRVTYLPVDGHGMVAVEDVERALTDRTILVTIMMANNEIGTINPVADIGELCRTRKILFHTDATQAVGKIPVDVTQHHLDLMSFTAHKMYGPKGVGALYVRRARPRLAIVGQMDGGGHEQGLRSGTLNVPSIVGFGRAAEIAKQELDRETEKISTLRNTLVDGIVLQLDNTWLNGHPFARLPHSASITFSGVAADKIMMEMKDVAVSSGSACSSMMPGPSHVLTAIGLGKQDVLSTIRFGLGRFTTHEEIEYTITRVVETVKSVRHDVRHYAPAQPHET
jgi:cysteine desulfurase